MSQVVADYLLKKNVMRGWFKVLDYKSRYTNAWEQLVSWVKAGKIKSRETHHRGLENIIEAFLGLFKGSNIGKTVVDVADKEVAAQNDSQQDGTEK